MFLLLDQAWRCALVVELVIMHFPLTLFPHWLVEALPAIVRTYLYVETKDRVHYVFFF